jgi:hypothetical protein
MHDHHYASGTMVTIRHRYATSDLFIDRGRLHPKDIFCEGDRIQVHGTQTKHHGRIARVYSIGEQRLSVNFEDGLSGKFVEDLDAVLIPERGTETSVPTPTQLRTLPVHASPASGTRSSTPPGRNNPVPRDNTRRLRTPHETLENSTPDVRHLHATNAGRSTQQRWNRATSELQMDREWRRQSESDAVNYLGTGDNKHPDDDYSILDNDDVTQDDHSVPNLIAELATHRVLDQFSITAATLITQHAEDNDTMEQLLQQFVRQVRLDVDTLATHLRPNDGH